MFDDGAVRRWCCLIPLQCLSRFCLQFKRGWTREKTLDLLTMKQFTAIVIEKTFFGIVFLKVLENRCWATEKKLPLFYLHTLRWINGFNLPSIFIFNSWENEPLFNFIRKWHHFHWNLQNQHENCINWKKCSLIKTHECLSRDFYENLKNQAMIFVVR